MDGDEDIKSLEHYKLYKRLLLYASAEIVATKQDMGVNTYQNSIMYIGDEKYE